MTTNLAESLNGVFKGTRFLPILGIVKATYYRLNAYFIKRATVTAAQMRSRQVYCETVTNALRRNQQSASACVVRTFDHSCSSFEVEEVYNHFNNQFGRICKVNLRDGQCKCDCGEFQALKYPCQHIIATCSNVAIALENYIDSIYRLDTILKTYRTEF